MKNLLLTLTSIVFISITSYFIYAGNVIYKIVDENGNEIRIDQEELHNYQNFRKYYFFENTGEISRKEIYEHGILTARYFYNYIPPILTRRELYFNPYHYKITLYQYHEKYLEIDYMYNMSFQLEKVRWKRDQAVFRELTYQNGSEYAGSGIKSISKIENISATTYCDEGLICIEFENQVGFFTHLIIEGFYGRDLKLVFFDFLIDGYDLGEHKLRLNWQNALWNPGYDFERLLFKINLFREDSAFLEGIAKLDIE